MHSHQSDPAQRRPPLGSRDILVTAARAGRRNFWRILAIAVVVTMAAALLEAISHDVIDRTNVPVTILTDLSTSSVSLLGVVFLSGFLSKLVGESAHGQRHARIRDVLKTLPWRRLIAADLLVVLIVAVGLIALVIPGFIALNLLAVVGPVIEIEHRPAIAALRRSGHLVRQHFWGVFLLATLPVLIVGALPATLPHRADVGRILMFLAIHGAAEGVIEAALGLVLVELCYRLIGLDRTTPAVAKPAADRTTTATAKPAAKPMSGTAGHRVRPRGWWGTARRSARRGPRPLAGPGGPACSHRMPGRGAPRSRSGRVAIVVPRICTRRR